MYLRKRSIIQLYYILIPVFFLIFMVQTPSSFAQTLIEGHVLDDQGNPISGIIIKAFDTNFGMQGLAAESDANGDYEIDLSWGGSEVYKYFYVLAQDENNNMYIPEWYNGVFNSGTYAFKTYLELIQLQSGTTETVDFDLWKWGNISVNLSDVPQDRGYSLLLKGTIDFKNTQNIDYERKKDLYQNELSSLPDNEYYFYCIPPGDYTVSIDDINLSIYHGEQGEVSSSTSYWYKIDNFNYFSSQYHDHESLEENADTINLSDGNTVSITFSNLPEVGMIYGIITDPNMNEKTSKNFQAPNEELPSDKTLVSYCIAQDPETNEWLDQITLVLNPDKIAIENIYLKIIPLSGQQVIAPIIPSKILKDPNSTFHIGAGSEFGYGGYAFKFLEPSGNYKIQLFRRLGNTDILNVYYKDATSVVYSEGEAGEISLSSGEKVKKVDIELPVKVTIYGYVTFGGQPITANVSLLTTPETHKISGYLADANCNSYFEFKELINGDFVVRIECDGYNVEKTSVPNVELGQNRDLGTIQLEPYEACSGNKTIQGRIFSEDNQNIGIENILVRVLNIEHIHRSDTCLEDVTDPNGRYSIPNLPDSRYILHTLITDPNIILKGYFNEMYKNVTLFGGPDNEENVFLPEIDEITNMKAYFDPLNIDPNIPATLIGFNEGQDVTNINVGLSNHVYHFPKGLNIFPYPGTPPIRYAGTSQKIIEQFSYDSYPKIMSFITNENKWEVAYRDPNGGQIKGDDFPIKAGQGYVLYLYEDSYTQLPPFTIVTPTFDMAQGLNFISLPDSFEKEYYSQNMLSDLGEGEGKASSINNYNCQTGKWKSTTCLWGLPAGDNFKFERHQGYSVYMKSPNP